MLTHTNRKLIITALLISGAPLQAAPLSVSGSSQDSVSITLYNQDLGLVRDIRNLPRINQDQTLYIEDVSHQILGETLQVENAGKILEQNLNNYLISSTALLQAYIGKSLKLARFNSVSGSETISDIRLLSIQGNHAVIESNNQIETIPINREGWRFIFPALPEGMQARPSLEIRSQGTRNAGKAELTYLTRGLNWQMNYAVILNETGNRLKLEGLASLSNQTGVDFRNSKILLMAGQVNQAPRQDLLRHKTAMMMAESVADSGAPEQFQDYQLYRLPYQTSLLNGQTKQVSLISADKVSASKTYHFNFPVYNSLDRTLYDQKPDIRVTFNNRSSDGLGFPLPAGVARVFSPDSDGLRHFIGSATIRHTSKGQTTELPIGKAFDITIKRRQTGFKKSYDSYLIDQEVTLRNARNKPVTVTLSADFNQSWKMRNSNLPFKKVNASRSQWAVEIPADGEAQLQFSVELSKQ